MLKYISFIQKDKSGKEKDVDLNSEGLQYFHEVIWNKRFKCFFEHRRELKAGEVRDDYLYYRKKDYKFRLASDTLFTGFKDNRRITEKDIPKEFHRLAHTFGGKIIFPKCVNSINQRRGFNTKIHDRIDFTLKYIRDFYNSEWYEKWNDDNKLFQKKDQNGFDRDFFKFFGSFENFIEFFFLQDFVRGNQVIDLMKSENIGKFDGKLIEKDDNPCFPQIKKPNKNKDHDDIIKDNYNDPSTDLGRWRINSMNLLRRRNERIGRFIENHHLEKQLQQIISKYFNIQNHKYLYLK